MNVAVLLDHIKVNVDGKCSSMRQVGVGLQALAVQLVQRMEPDALFLAAVGNATAIARPPQAGLFPDGQASLSFSSKYLQPDDRRMKRPSILAVAPLRTRRTSHERSFVAGPQSPRG